MQKADLVVVGTGMILVPWISSLLTSLGNTGWSGLAAAKTYIELHPTSNVVVLEAAGTVGGVWAEHRLYPGLKSNNMLGTYEYPDFPMDPSFGVTPGQHIPGTILHKYLTAFAQKFGVLERTKFNSKVESATKQGDQGWLLKVSTNGNDEELLTEQLIVATGLTSDMFTPDFEGAESFDAPIFHSKDFREHADTLETAENVVVFGGTKSAWDAAYAYAIAGVQVDMVIRESGHGPIWMVSISS